VAVDIPGGPAGELGRPADALAAFQQVIDRYGEGSAPALREQVAAALYYSRASSPAAIPAWQPAIGLAFRAAHLLKKGLGRHRRRDRRSHTPPSEGFQNVEVSRFRTRRHPPTRSALPVSNRIVSSRSPRSS
jgi:hypothetical protein